MQLILNSILPSFTIPPQDDNTMNTTISNDTADTNNSHADIDNTNHPDYNSRSPPSDPDNDMIKDDSSDYAQSQLSYIPIDTLQLIKPPKCQHS
jgi:hypothetical protein